MKFILKYTQLFISSNILKILLIIVAYLSFSFNTNRIKWYDYDVNIKTDFLKEIKLGDDKIYLMKSSSGDYEVNKIDKTYVVDYKSKVLIHKESSWLYIIFWGILVISILIVGILSIFTEDYSDFTITQWNFKLNYIKTINFYLEKIYDTSTNITYYVYNNRIIHKCNGESNETDFKNKIRKYIKSPMLYDKFEGTELQIRNNKINLIINSK